MRVASTHGWLKRFRTAYGEALTSTEAVASYLTILLAGASWGIEVLGNDDPAWTLAAIGTGWAGALAGGLVIARGAVTGLLAREVNVDELVTLAIVASLASGEYLGAALVAFMMLFGKVLEDVTAARANDAIAALGRLVPQAARVVRGGSEFEVPLAALATGDVVAVRPGERVPVDGTVASGRAWVDEAAITGESSPASRGPGDTVFAGTLASGGALEVTVAKTGPATTLGRIATLVAEATAERAPIVRTADRWARWFTPGVLALAGVTWAATGAFDQAVAVLVVACPCALTLATPTAIVATVARAARQGILVRGGARVEASGSVTVACLDKTGTLTTGTPSVVTVRALSAWSPAEVLSHAAAVEARSEHPLARAIVAAASQAPGVPWGASQFVAEAGNGVVGTLHAIATTDTAAHADMAPPTTVGTVVVVGRPAFVRTNASWWDAAVDVAIADVEAAGQTPVVVAIDGTVAGVIALGDTVRPDAAEAVAALRRHGIQRVLLVTGDATGPAHAVARAVGIPAPDVHAGLLPQAKVATVRALQAAGHHVAMVGDGVNDAPALSASNLGIAMGAGGTDLAMTAADVVLLRNRLVDVAHAIGLGRDAMHVVRQNLVIAAAWNVVAVAAAASGVTGIVAGALVHNVGSVGVVVNAARLVGKGHITPLPSAVATGEG